MAHTHAACDVFHSRTKDANTRIEIRTIDALIVAIASIYHQALGLPKDVTAWAWRDGGKGFDQLAAHVAAYLQAQPMIGAALAARFPIVICDEHQDSSPDRHEVTMAFHRGGSRIRFFGDPMQIIYGQTSNKQARIDRGRWQTLLTSGTSETLRQPHRWDKGDPDLGKWVMAARDALEHGRTLDLRGGLPNAVTVLKVNNLAAQRRNGFQLEREERRPLDTKVSRANQVMVLASSNAFVSTLRAFWARSIPLWEGHTREALVTLTEAVKKHEGDAGALAEATSAFLNATTHGFSPSSHGRRFVQEARENCVNPSRGKPAHIQAAALKIVQEPNHRGVAAALGMIRQLGRTKADGFAKFNVDHHREFGDALHLGTYADAEQGFADIARRRSHARPRPPQKALSTVHKAKGWSATTSCWWAVMRSSLPTHSMRALNFMSDLVDR